MINLSTKEGGNISLAVRAVLSSMKHRLLPLLADEMRKEWDQRARENAMGMIATWQREWVEDDFFGSGESDVRRLAQPFLNKVHFDPSDKRMLEIGCGVGRMTRAFAKQFKVVDATDVSELMIEKAKSLHLEFPNIRWSVGNGVDLRQYPTSFFDFCFSYIVFQHIPTERAILGYVKEIARVLKPGAIFRFQVQNVTTARRFVVVASNKVPFIRKKIIMTAQLHDTWGGAYVSRKKLERVIRRNNLQLTELTGEGTQFMWAEGRKNGGPEC